MLQKSLPQLIINISIYFSFDYYYTYTFPPSQMQHFLLPTDFLSVKGEPCLGIPYSTPIMPKRLLVLLLRNKLMKRFLVTYEHSRIKELRDHVYQRNR